MGHIQIALVTEENKEMFLGVVPGEVLEVSHLYLGAIDEDTDTACGVLAAMVDVDGNLLLTYVFVAEDFRMMGAGKELIEALKELAADGEAKEISCIHEKMADSDGVYELLDSCGFTEFELATTSTYEVLLRDLVLPNKKVTSKIVPLSALSDEQWLTYYRKINMLDEMDDTGNVTSLSKRENYDGDHSVAYIDGDGQVMGALILSFDGDAIYVEGLRVLGENMEMVTLDLIISGIQRAKAGFSGDMPVVMSPFYHEQMALLSRFSDGRVKKRSDTVVQIYSL